MEELVVLRFVNVFYYLCFFSYMVVVLCCLVKNKDRQPYKTALRIFLATGIVLLIMEYSGTIVGMRVFYINGELNVFCQFVLQTVMAFGEGGAATAIIYLMVNAIFNKNYKKYIGYLSSLGFLMLIFAGSTFFYNLNIF
ncbi:MAG: hypothetical protein ACOC44_03170 [Promethearchaeia archaeon]